MKTLNLLLSVSYLIAEFTYGNSAPIAGGRADVAPTFHYNNFDPMEPSLPSADTNQERSRQPQVIEIGQPGTV